MKSVRLRYKFHIYITRHFYKRMRTVGWHNPQEKCQTGNTLDCALEYSNQSRVVLGGHGVGMGGRVIDTFCSLVGNIKSSSWSFHWEFFFLFCKPYGSYILFLTTSYFFSPFALLFHHRCTVDLSIEIWELTGPVIGAVLDWQSKRRKIPWAKKEKETGWTIKERGIHIYIQKKSWRQVT